MIRAILIALLGVYFLAPFSFSKSENGGYVPEVEANEAINAELDKAPQIADSQDLNTATLKR